MAKAQTPRKSPTPRPDGRGALMVGGVPGNAGGRPKEAWRRKVREALEEAGGVQFLVKVVKGEVLDQTEDEDGNVITAPLKVRDRILAANILIEQAHGKPPQEVTLEDERPRPTGEQIMGRILELLPKVIAALPVDRKQIARALAEQRRIEVLVQGREVSRDEPAEARGGGAG